MDLWHSLNGMVTIQITSADPAGVITSLHGYGIPVDNVRFVDELTLHFQVPRQYRKQVINLVEKRGDQWKTVSRNAATAAATAR